MGKKKNKLKNNINYCFVCGKNLDNISDKIIHRINNTKGITKNNVVILCPKCKNDFSLGKLNIFLINIKQFIINRYFKNQDNNYKKTILKSLQYQRSKYGKK
jgi:hypothetical protein